MRQQFVCLKDGNETLGECYLVEDRLIFQDYVTRRILAGFPEWLSAEDIQQIEHRLRSEEEVYG